MLKSIYISKVLANSPEVHFRTFLNSNHIELYNIVNISLYSSARVRGKHLLFLLILCLQTYYWQCLGFCSPKKGMLISVLSPEGCLNFLIIAERGYCCNSPIKVYFMDALTSGFVIFFFTALRSLHYLWTEEGNWNCFPPKAMLIVLISPAGYLTIYVISLSHTLISRVYQGRWFFPFAVFVGIYFSIILLILFLNSFHRSLIDITILSYQYTRLHTLSSDPAFFPSCLYGAGIFSLVPFLLGLVLYQPLRRPYHGGRVSTLFR